MASESDSDSDDFMPLEEIVDENIGEAAWQIEGYLMEGPVVGVAGVM